MYHRLSILLFLIPLPIQSKTLVSVADVAEMVMPSVVNIRTTQYTPNKDPNLDLYQFFLGGKIPQNQSSHSVGSGVLVDTAGHILTNFHVIEGASSIEVLLAANKKKYQAKVVGSDPKTDLALLKIEANTKLKPIDIGNSDTMRIGDVVIAIGNPFGYSHTVTSGIISAKGRVLGTGPYDDFLQTDALIHPGNSGGPLIDVRGRMIGINAAVSEEGAGIGFAIPSNIAKSVMRDLRAFGKARRPWIGVVGKNASSSTDALSTSWPGVHGIIVANIVVDSPAHKAGIQIGDVIVSLDSKRVADMNQVQRNIADRSIQSKVKIKIYRRGKGYVNTTASLEETPKTDELPQERDIF
jgi:serine protease Do